MDLFDKLKTEPSIPKVSRDKKADVESPGSSSETSVTVSSKQKTTKDKSCSLSPTKSENSFTAAANKQVRVVLERSKAITTAIHQQSSSPEQGSKTLKNLTPTKAQIKQFDPAVLRKAQELQTIRIRKCYVRLKRFNMNDVKGSKKAGAKSLLKKASVKSSPAIKKSRDASESLSPATPANKSSPKRSKGTAQTSPPAKKTKLTPKTSGQFHVKLTSPLRKSSFSARKEHNEWPKAKKIENKKNLSVTPTKFSRSKLIDQFGKRYFSAIVKVERCQHPTMVAFDSDAREQRSKRNKSKNLSVSFHSQVEIYDMSSKKRGGSKKMLKKKDQKSPEPVTLPLPARLQKIENGMVVNDIELDQSIFFNSSTVNLAASTPLTIKRSQNLPFKDDSATKASFVQPADNDDEVEFIVPEINIPEKLLTSLTKPTPSPNRRSAEKSKEQNEKAEKSPKGQSTKSSLQTKGTPKKTTPTKSSSVKNTPTKTNSSTPTRTAQNKTSQSQLQSLSTPTKSPAKPNDAVGKTTPQKVSKKLSENMKEAVEEKEKSTNVQHAEERTTKSNETIIEDLVESKVMKAAEVVVSSEFNINEDSTSKLVLRAESEEQGGDTEQIKTINDNANSSGESFASALTETGNFVEKANDEVTHRTRVETETISESSNASTDVQLASSEASNTTMPKSIEVSSKSSPKLTRQQSNSNSNFESVEDVSLRTVVMEELRFDETNEEPEIQSKLAATPTAPYTANDMEKGKSILSESPDSVGISAKSSFHSSFAAKLAQIESTSNVASIMDLPINLLGEDTESSSDVHKKVDNLIADLMDDNERQADTTDSVLNNH